MITLDELTTILIMDGVAKSWLYTVCSMLPSTIDCYIRYLKVFGLSWVNPDDALYGHLTCFLR